jgi:hypothetical protein
MIRKMASCLDLRSGPATPLRTRGDLPVVRSSAGLKQHGKSVILLILTPMAPSP